MLLPTQLHHDAAPALALSNGLALTPPMGWNSWYGFKCHVDQNTVKDMTDAIISSGMKAAGYRFVNLDDCWQCSRAADGTIQADAGRFPDGIKALADYVHAQGLQLGIYTDAGSTTCMGKPCSLGHEQQDADTYAQWGVDFVRLTGVQPAASIPKCNTPRCGTPLPRPVRPTTVP